MPVSKKLLAGAAAGVALVLSAGAAFAYPADATASVNVRSGPGTSYPVVGTLAPGEAVNVGRCTSSWCDVTDPGRPGWVAAAYLGHAPVHNQYVPPAYYAPYAYDDWPDTLGYLGPIYGHPYGGWGGAHFGGHHWTGGGRGMHGGGMNHSGGQIPRGNGRHRG